MFTKVTYGWRKPLWFLLLAIASSLLITFVLPTGQVLPYTRYPNLYDSYVNDIAGILSPRDRDNLRRDLSNFHDRTGKQIMVTTIHSFRDYTSGGSFDSFAIDLFNQRGVGDRWRNDGAMVLVAPRDRKVRITLGRGYGARLDGRMQNIINSYMLPEFRQGRLAAGTINGTRALMDELRMVRTAEALPVERRTADMPNIGTGIVILLIPILIVFVIVYLIVKAIVSLFTGGGQTNRDYYNSYDHHRYTSSYDEGGTSSGSGASGSWDYDYGSSYSSSDYSSGSYDYGSSYSSDRDEGGSSSGGGASGSW